MSVIFYDIEIKNVIERILATYPFVRQGEINSYPAYHIGNGDSFLVIRQNSIAVKVPGPMANLLTEIYQFPRILPCDELKGLHWVLITRKKPEEYIADKAVINEAILYALGLVY